MLPDPDPPEPETEPAPPEPVPEDVLEDPVWPPAPGS